MGALFASVNACACVRLFRFFAVRSRRSGHAARTRAFGRRVKKKGYYVTLEEVPRRSRLRC
eukprot:3099473-Alexandrium_andersonii.AAC.1